VSTVTDAKLRRALDHGGREAETAKPERGNGSSDTRPGDKNGQLPCRHRTPLSGRFSVARQSGSERSDANPRLRSGAVAVAGLRVAISLTHDADIAQMLAAAEQLLASTGDGGELCPRYGFSQGTPPEVMGR
jgi:hypothetical protein